MKKLVAVLAAVSMIAMTACGGGKAAPAGTQGAETKQTEKKDSGETIKLIMGHCDPEDENDPYHQTCIAFKNALEELSGGKVVVTVYPNAQLGDERTVIEAVQNGSVNCSAVTTAITSNFQPLTKIMDFPFLFASLEEAREASGSPAAQKILDSMDSVGIKGLAFTENGFRYILNNKHTITKPEDLAGLKLRVMQSPVYMDFYNQVNCSATPLPFGEVYTAVSQGTVDGFDLPIPVILSSKLYEISKYMTDIRYTYTSLMIIMNKEQFDSYPEEVQGWIMEAAQRARTANFAKNDEVVAKGVSEIKDKVEVTAFEDVDFEAFRDVSRPVWDSQADAEGAKEILDEILALQKK